MKENYHKIMLNEIEKNKNENKIPKLLLHSCCGPCSSYVIKFLSDYFDMKILFFNPNIYPKDEYMKRLEEQIQLVKDMNFNYEVIGPEYKSEVFYETVKGYEKLGEGSERCFNCFNIRLEETAKYAKEKDFDYFTTTLTISPMKNATKINEIGMELETKYNIKFLNSDFKKENGYKQSVELSKEFNLYRQDYCGCVFSKQEAIKRMENKENS